MELDPDNNYAHLGFAHVLKSVGHQKDAIAAYRAGIALRPDFGEAYWSLANLKTFRFTPDEIATMQEQVQHGELRPSTAAHFCFALGKAFEDAGDYDTAWHWYQDGNRRQRPLVSHDPLIMEDRHTANIETFTAEFLRAHEGHGASTLPIPFS